ncbi:hypothetical protein KUTeg_003754 [Tegillarca granosa]|uniref:G-protein coupled receptors family 1 profile domain-containing protein n=1 Tax=Tegillarca granosa TaxID=220873 RepID=A0ABQ9FN11_TEGGR|nr:hypothetical protein KUTeg_003754 [Tegillarca granosa]
MEYIQEQTTMLVSNTTNDSDESNVPAGHTPLKVPIYLQVTIITMYSAIILLAVGGNGTVCYIRVQS